MTNLADLIIPKVNAQSDAVAQPTFGTIDVGGDSTGITASVLVSADKTAAQIGDIVTLRIEVKTRDIAINEYRVILDFDPARFAPLDQDNDTQGTQISLLDTIFEVEDASTDNIVQSGRVTLIAKTQSGNSFTVNRDVAEIKLQAQSAGSSTIKIVEGSGGTQLVRPTGFGVTFTTNEVSVGVTSTPQDSSDDQTDGGDTGSTPTPTPVDQIPATAIFSTFEQAITVLIGIMLVITGLVISFRRWLIEKTKKS